MGQHIFQCKLRFYVEIVHSLSRWPLGILELLLLGFNIAAR